MAGKYSFVFSYERERGSVKWFADAETQTSVTVVAETLGLRTVVEINVITKLAP